MTAEHSQQFTSRILLHFPEHAPRASDPHYRLFEAARRRMKAAGLLKCAVCGTDQNVELHHSHIEFAYANAIDLTLLDSDLGLHLNEDEFQDWIESVGNLEALCVVHHRGAQAVHSLPEPVWNAVRMAKQGIVIAEVVHGCD